MVLKRRRVMKKIVLFIAMATTLSTADMIGGEVNIGYYSHTPSGVANYDGDRADIEKDLNWGSEQDIFFKVYFEHPIPLIPNIKVGYSNFSHEGHGTASKDFSWGGVKLFTLEDTVDTKLDLSMSDITLYYEILDNWLNLDIGVNIKYLDGFIDVETTTEKEHKTFEVPLPMLYAKARFDIPATDVSFQIEGNYVSYDGNTVYDVEMGARYTFLLGLGVEAGYKAFKLKFDDVDDLSLDADFSGLYGKVVWDF